MFLHDVACQKLVESISHTVFRDTMYNAIILFCRRTSRSCWTCCQASVSWLGTWTHISLTRTRNCSGFPPHRTVLRSCCITSALWWLMERRRHWPPRSNQPKSRPLCPPAQVSIQSHFTCSMNVDSTTNHRGALCPVYTMEQTSSKRRANVFKNTRARRMLDVCPMFLVLVQLARRAVVISMLIRRVGGL